jgi:hypothetical protein
MSSKMRFPSRTTETFRKFTTDMVSTDYAHALKVRDERLATEMTVLMRRYPDSPVEKELT